MDTIYNRFPWLYAFFRERLFRDDTARIAAAVWPDATPPAEARILEMGCGPGFYSMRLAAQFRQLHVLGVDVADRLIARAQREAARKNLRNCRFHCADAREINVAAESMDAVIISRLLLIIGDRKAALAEAYRVLRPGGVCFIAEPRDGWRVRVPYRIMWGFARCIAAIGGPQLCSYSGSAPPTPLSAAEFGALTESQSWQRVRTWTDGDYQYAVCWRNHAAARA